MSGRDLRNCNPAVGEDGHAGGDGVRKQGGFKRFEKKLWSDLDLPVKSLDMHVSMAPYRLEFDYTFLHFFIN